MRLRLFIGWIVTLLYWRHFFGKAGVRCVIFGNQFFIGCRDIFLGNRVHIFPWCRIEGVRRYNHMRFSPRLSIGDGTQIHQSAHITFAGDMKIGRGVVITARCTVSDIIHPASNPFSPANNADISVDPVTIEDNVYIYNNAVILPGVTIGQGSIIAANSVVTKSVPRGALVAGIPARIIKLYNSNTESWEKSS